LLFTDVEGSTGLWEAHRDATAEASARHNRLVREQIEATGGQVSKTVGETFRVVPADPPAAHSDPICTPGLLIAEDPLTAAIGG
jgi:class 3 adenylate cyclase